jgi:hypothetical protein
LPSQETLLVLEVREETEEMVVTEETLQQVQTLEVQEVQQQATPQQLEVLHTLAVLLDILNREVLLPQQAQHLLRALEVPEVQVVMRVTEETDLLLELVLVLEEREEQLVFLVPVTSHMSEELSVGLMQEQWICLMQQEM